MDQITRGNEIINQIAALLNEVSPDRPTTPLKFAAVVATRSLSGELPIPEDQVVAIAADIENSLYLHDGTIH